MSLIGLGKAYELEFVRDGSKRRQVVSFPGHWWAWSGTPDGGNILLVKPIEAGGKISRVAHDTHAEFHGADPKQALHVEAPTMTGAKMVGLVVSFAYDARSFSSSKRSMPYRHHFGAETHDDQPPFPASAMPGLYQSLSGSLIIKRRSGNSFRLADWVIG